MASFSTDTNHDYDPNRGNDYDGIIRKLNRASWTVSGLVRKLVKAINAWRNSSSTTLDRW